MKTDEDAKPATTPPVNSEDSRPSTSRKKAEPAFEMRPNFSRVTPAQLTYITFSSEGRYQPVRPVSANPQASKGTKRPSSPATTVWSAGGGGIIILSDPRPSEEAEFIEIEAPATDAAAPILVPVPAEVHSEPTGHHISLDENAPEADPPEPFEVRFHVEPCCLYTYLSLLVPF